MPRYPRNFIKTSYFHVVTQGINKNYIFNFSEDIKKYIKDLRKLSIDYKINIIAFCIMNNHAHMLLETNNIKDLSKYMQSLNTRYAKYYNKKYNRVGYVFRDRYKCEGIYTEEHLYNCILYIYNNPVKAKICQKPEDYPYSNYDKKVKITKEGFYKFIDENENEEEISQEIIKEFLEDNNITFEELQKDKKMLRYLIISLKDKQNISVRKIASTLKIGRETVRNLYRT